MGLLIGEKSTTLEFKESKKFQRLLKRNAAKQLAKLLASFEKFEKSDTESLKFGTELECHLVHKVKVDSKELMSVSIDSKSLMKDLNQRFPEVEAKEEFAAWMIEFIPIAPFELFLSLNEIRKHFKYIDLVSKFYKPEIIMIPGLSVLPHIGTPNYYIKNGMTPANMNERSNLNKLSKSDFFLDETITEHSRMHTFTQNVPIRKGEKVAIKIPVYKDLKTKADNIVLDHFGFGMCNTALQVTFSCKNLEQARFAHDMMHVISPFLLTLSSSTFAAQQKLIDLDNRFNIIEQATDERKGGELVKLKKSRYSSINYFLSNDPKFKKKYNDNAFTLNLTFLKDLKGFLKSENSNLFKDRQLLNHFAYIFVRDYLIVFPERIKKDFADDTIDFESMQSSNWHSMRLKPPSSYDSKLGWLLEFRCLDSPVTEIEKSLLIFIVTLFYRIVSDPKMKINFYMPISLVDINFQRSFQRNSLINQKFYFRRHFCPLLQNYIESDEIIELSMHEFFVGSESFAGMTSLFKVFVEANQSVIDKEFKKTNENIVEIIANVTAFYTDRCNGKLSTLPIVLRDFVLAHKEYQQDSVLNDQITSDVINKAIEIQENNYEKSMFGSYKF